MPDCACGCGGSVVSPDDHYRERRFLHGHNHRRDGFTPEQRFWAKVEKGDGCWLWTAGCTSAGYGQFHLGQIDGRSTKIEAHRFSYILHNGPVPKGMYVCHHCDNPPCVNPAHLFLGTMTDNMLDMVRKGRARNQYAAADTGEHDYRMSDEPGDLRRKFLDDAL